MNKARKRPWTDKQACLLEGFRDHDHHDTPQHVPAITIRAWVGRTVTVRKCVYVLAHRMAFFSSRTRGGADENERRDPRTGMSETLLHGMAWHYVVDWGGGRLGTGTGTRTLTGNE